MNIKERIALAWGKIRRLYYAFLRPRYVAANLERRRGECAQCGACCQLLFTCPYLTTQEGVPTCKIHDKKWKVCRLFPIDEADVRDRNIVSPRTKCGYYFVPKG